MGIIPRILKLLEYVSVDTVIFVYRKPKEETFATWFKRTLEFCGYVSTSSTMFEKKVPREEFFYEMQRTWALLECVTVDRIILVVEEPKEETFDTWVEDMPRSNGYKYMISDDLRVAAMQTICDLIQNGLLQEELDWQDISFIAGNLYMSGYLKQHELDQIQDKSQPRRKAVDNLVDSIIGNPSAVLAFMRILESESQFSYIAEQMRSAKRSAAALEKPENVIKISQKQTEPCFVTNIEIISHCQPYAFKMEAIVMVEQMIWNQVGKLLDLEFKEVLKGPFQDKESSQKQ